MATFLALSQDVCRRIGIAAPATIVNNTATTAARLLAQGNKAGKALTRKRPFMVLQEEHTFSTADGTAAYALPSDFDRIVDDSVWDRSNYWEVRGPLNPQEWQAIKSGLATSAQLRKRFRIKSTSGTRQFYIDPTPSAVETMVFEYISSHWCEDSGGTGQAALAADTDVLRIDEELWSLDMEWRMLRSLGLDYEEERTEAERALSAYFGSDGGAPVLFLSRRRVDLPVGNVPDTGFGT